MCKSNCQSKFKSSRSSGVFRWQDGAEIPCEAVPGVVRRENTPQTFAQFASFAEKNEWPKKKDRIAGDRVGDWQAVQVR